MARVIENWNPLRRCASVAVVAAAVWVALGAATPVMAGGRYIYDTSHYRPMHGRERTIFRNPVGKLGPGVTRRLPSLTPKPAEFDFGAEPIKIEAPAGSAAKARRTNPAAPVIPATPPLPDVSLSPKTP
jgi:hypothetical protein